MNQEIMSPTPIELFQSNLIYTLIVLSFLSLLTKIKKKKACTIPMAVSYTHLTLPTSDLV